ncbi:hypothetical protein [Bremerella cremea]|uniref:hypothetical protein n=1 Tax=Bremerella cremea TaxID=1031537 RepID=UPI0031EDE717
MLITTLIVVIVLLTAAGLTLRHWMAEGNLHMQAAQQMREMGARVQMKLIQDVSLTSKGAYSEGSRIGRDYVRVEGGPTWMAAWDIEPAFQRVDLVFYHERSLEKLEAFLELFGQLGQVDILSIVSPEVTNDHVERLLQQVRLKTLLLQGEQIGGEPMPFLKSSQLEDLAFAHTSLRDEGLDDLPESLTQLTLTGNHLTEGGLKKLIRLKKLKQLEIDQAGISRQTLKELQKEMPWCWVVT